MYKTVAENMAGKKVIIRTLDIGADKQVDYFGLEHEENPAMGYRVHPYLPGSAGYLQNTASCVIPRQRIWNDFYYVSDDYFSERSETN